MSNHLGIATNSQVSSFTTKMNHYKACSKPFAKNMFLFTNFAHRCELIGVAPEMVFRIADKKRDKKIRLADL